MKSIDTIRLRATIGWLGLLLPWIVLILFIAHGEAEPLGHVFPDSISATYYFESTITPFMIILGSAGLLLMCYTGYTWVDNLLNKIIGLSALAICLFPCCNWVLIRAGYIGDYVGTFQCPVVISGWVHNIGAVLFFVLLAYECLFLFTKSSGEMTANKKKRNIIYRICGIGMAVSLIGIVFVGTIWSGTWWVEAIALMFFGVAFLTKADIYPWLFCDTPYAD